MISVIWVQPMAFGFRCLGQVPHRRGAVREGPQIRQHRLLDPEFAQHPHEMDAGGGDLRVRHIDAARRQQGRAQACRWSRSAARGAPPARQRRCAQGRSARPARRAGRARRVRRAGPRSGSPRRRDRRPGTLSRIAPAAAKTAASSAPVSVVKPAADRRPVPWTRRRREDAGSCASGPMSWAEGPAAARSGRRRDGSAVARGYART